MTNKEQDHTKRPRYIRIFLNAFFLSFVVFLILTYFRNNGFVPFRYLFF